MLLPDGAAGPLPNAEHPHVGVLLEFVLGEQIRLVGVAEHRLASDAPAFWGDPIGRPRHDHAPPRAVGVDVNGGETVVTWVGKTIITEYG